MTSRLGRRYLGYCVVDVSGGPVHVASVSAGPDRSPVRPRGDQVYPWPLAVLTGNVGNLKGGLGSAPAVSGGRWCCSIVRQNVRR